MNIKFNNKKSLLLLSFLMPLLGYSESQVTNETSYFSNPLFNLMIGIIILLLIVIVVLTQSLKNLAKSDYLTRKNNDENNMPNKVKLSVVLFFTFFASQLNAQGNTSHSWNVSGIDVMTFFILCGVIILEIIFVATLLNTFSYLLRSNAKAETVKSSKKEKSILEIINASVEIEQEAEILMDHDYDGIRELDNDLPPWWRYGFYLTILVAFIYMVHFHISKTGDLQLSEYNKEVEKGKKDVEEFMKLSASNVDESSIKMLQGDDIAEGKNIFITTCAACHGRNGEGGVGPNLTDSFWVNGGSIVDIFKIIKYGKPDKGMKSWKEEVSPIQIAQLASFIKTLLNTNPANPKAKQGDLYVEKSELKGDTAVVVKDSIPSLSIITQTKSPEPELKK